MKNLIFMMGVVSIFIGGCEYHSYDDSRYPHVVYTEPNKPVFEVVVEPSPVFCLEPEPNNWSPMYCFDDQWGTYCTWAEDTYYSPNSSPIAAILCDVTYYNDYYTCGWYFWDEACVVEEF